MCTRALLYYRFEASFRSPTGYSGIADYAAWQRRHWMNGDGGSNPVWIMFGCWLVPEVSGADRKLTGFDRAPKAAKS